MYSKNQIMKMVKDIVGLQMDINCDEKLMKYGIDSISIMKLVGAFRKAGYKVKFADLMDQPTINAWYELLEKFEKREEKDITLAEQKFDDTEPFDLTDVQYAYWVGREDEQVLGGVDCHAYYEFKGTNIDLIKLQDAWNKLAIKHKALRTCIKDGKQYVKNKAYEKTIFVKDFSFLTLDEAEKSCMEVRKRISHRKLNIGEGEVAGLTVCLLPNKQHILCIDFALIVADVKSIQILLRDLAKLYINETGAEKLSDWNFRKYVALQNEIRKEERKAAKEYWKNKVQNMPLAPLLPLEKDPACITKPENTHYTSVIDNRSWKCFTEKCKKAGVTVPMVLLTAYAQVINKWSSNNNFLINVPLFDRAEEYCGILNAVGDFTTLLLTSHDFSQTLSFAEMIENTQSDFIHDMHYAACSGVEVQRMLQQEYPGQSEFAPVVFACNIGLDFIDDNFSRLLGSIHYMVSQTPQVWIDCQTFERSGELYISWDVCDELFPQNMPQEMFDTYIAYIKELALEKSDWNIIRFPATIKEEKRKTVEKTLEEYPEKKGLLTDGLIENAINNPYGKAVYDSFEKREITFVELYQRSFEFAKLLEKSGVVKNEKVAVKLPRGIKQVIAIYGILLAGCVYVPVSYNQPEKRLAKIIDTVGIQFVVANEKITVDAKQNFKTILFTEKNVEKTENVQLPKHMDTRPDDTAYIIMTSGSTGEPKGVEITHQSAVNTILDVNRRNEIRMNDNFISISAIDFDLSVYDIFGSAMAGACFNILCEENAKDSDFWLTLLCERNITVWNSVPVLFDMLLTAIENRKEIPPLRRILLSGDWISVSLAKRIYKVLPDVTLVAMGGATEASIWSNECIVPKNVPQKWNYIPYGYALSGQIYRIVDTNGNDCPDWVPGELYIGGFGVAKGYAGDEEKTKQKFTQKNGITWYHTGDIGRFCNDGMIEFLGRMDYQVKIKGHRIELEEIEAAVCEDPDVESAVAVVSEYNEQRYIVLYYTGKNNIDEKKLIKNVSCRIPAYMLPKKWKHLERLPVTGNGKIDRKALPKIEFSQKENIANRAFKNEIEQGLAEIWKKLLNVSIINREDDYFELGGNSLTATKIIYQIKEKFGVKIKMNQIFRFPSLAEMAEQIEHAKEEFIG